MNLVQLLLAFIFAHAFHSLAESSNVLAKIARLSDAIAKRTLRPYPMNINTRAKAYALAAVIVLVTTGIAYSLLHLVDLTDTSMLATALSLLIVVEVFNTIKFDRYHIAIEKLIKKYAKK